MSIYTVQAPVGSLGKPEFERAVFLREGFSWGAFIFSFFWLLWQRLWLVAVVWLVAESVLTSLYLRGLSFGSTLLIGFLLHLLLGLEGNSLLRSRLARRRYRLVGVVSAAALEPAERQLFTRVAQKPLQTSPAPNDPPPPAPPVPTQHADVIGVFPEPEMRR
ncbi:MAG TPA: DUF2628 domain-containing protein [Methylovirgula sp.]